MASAVGKTGILEVHFNKMKPSLGLSLHHEQQRLLGSHICGLSLCPKNLFVRLQRRSFGVAPVRLDLESSLVYAHVCKVDREREWILDKEGSKSSRVAMGQEEGVTDEF